MKSEDETVAGEIEAGAAASFSRLLNLRPLPSSLSLRAASEIISGPEILRPRLKGKKMRHLTRVTLLIAFMASCAPFISGQERVRSVNASVNTSVASAIDAARNDPTFITPGSKVYVNEIRGFEGFENYLVAAFKKKKVDLLVVTDRSLADFEITGYSESQKAGWAKIIFSSGLPEEEASIQVINLRTSVVAFAVASYKVDAINGKKSTAEHLAKNLRQKMERDLRRK